MLVVAVPHGKPLNLNQKYYVYDTDDGCIESVYADEIMSMLYQCPEIMYNVAPGFYGGMEGRVKPLPDGVYKVQSDFEDNVTMRISGGIIVEPKNCEDALFVGSHRGVEYKFVKGKAVRF